MTYKITVQDGLVSVTVETEVADEAAAVLAVSVLQKVQRSKHFDLPRQPNYWDGPDRSGNNEWWKYNNPPGYPPGTVLCGGAYAVAEEAVARQCF